MVVIFLNTVSQLILVMETCCVLPEVWTEFLNVIQMIFGF
jgi:hypothetical protein